MLVAAAGNDGDATLNYPAAYAEVVSVAATDANDARASFSNANSRRRDRRARREHPVDVQRLEHELRVAVGHLDGDAPRRRRDGGHLEQVPDLDRFDDPLEADAAVDDKGAAGRDANFGFGRANLQKAATQ